MTCRHDGAERCGIVAGLSRIVAREVREGYADLGMPVLHGLHDLFRPSLEHAERDLRMRPDEAFKDVGEHAFVD